MDVLCEIRISTHDLQTEVDGTGQKGEKIEENISTHDLQTEVDGFMWEDICKVTAFQLTTSKRRSTISGRTSAVTHRLFQLTTSKRRSTAIFYKIPKDILSYLQHFCHLIPYITLFPLPSSTSLSCLLRCFWCETPQDFLFTPHSH